MSRYLSLHNLHNWSLSAKAQGATHLMPVLALLEVGAGTQPEVHFEESDDFVFWDKYLLINKGDEKPYFNPITLRRSEKGFPHSNAATIRKNTFRLKWGAGVSRKGDDGNTYWALSGDYANIFRNKVLRRGDNVTKVPALDLAVLFFRNDEFPSNSNSETLLDRFKQRFPQRDNDFQEMFSFHGEKAEELFTDDNVEIPNEYNAVILAELVSEKTEPPKVEISSVTPVPLEDMDDPLLVEVQQLLEMGTSGVIFKGPSGVGKTWYAQRIAATIVDDPEKDVFRVQFHPSYGYEDFVEGYKPDEDKKSGFGIIKKIFLRACERVEEVDGYVVVIIDEINRGDPARIFGELLTYIETEYRGRRFFLPFSGEEVQIPKNLILFGTMNPHDRSVSQVDIAFVRRFDHILVEPSSEVVQQMLENSEGFPDDQIAQVVDWFENAQRMLDDSLGHSFFKDVKDINRLKFVWKHRIWPTAEAIFEFNPARKDDFERSFQALLRRLEGAEDDG